MRNILLGVLVGVALGVAACGSDGGGDGCPGKVCNNCGASGDCNLTCPSGQVQYCGHFGYFDDPNLRCTWCGAP